MTRIPFLGETVMRMRNSDVERRIFDGGVVDAAALSDSFSRELVNVGNRDGYQRGFLNLLRREHYWEGARQHYPKIAVPVILIYGDQDWAPERERDRTKSLIPSVQSATVIDGGHFLTLDKPQELFRLITEFVTSESRLDHNKNMIQQAVR